MRSETTLNSKNVEEVDVIECSEQILFMSTQSSERILVTCFSTLTHTHGTFTLQMDNATFRSHWKLSTK
jgi:hypothetical protein